MTERPPPPTGTDGSAPNNSIIVEVDDDPHIGMVLNNRYRVDERLGVGGYGVVYRGVYLEHQIPVAIKMLRPAEDHSQEVRARFRREGEALGSLKSKHTVRTYEFGYTEDGTMYIAMELLQGRTLKEESRKLGQLPWRRTLTILEQICDALTEAHAIGYVHRDLKPENIFLLDRPDGSDDDDDMVKVLDFGIVKKLQFHGHQQEGDTQLTAHGQTVGTMRYMSPEQLLGQPVDSRSDIYSMGVLAHRMLTGRVPFPKAKNMARLIAAQLQQTPNPPSHAAPDEDIPEDVDRLVLCMLEKTPQARLPNTEVLRMACRELLDTGTWVSASQYVRKSPDQAQADDATIPAAAVDVMALASMLDSEARASLAVLTGSSPAVQVPGMEPPTDRQPAMPPPPAYAPGSSGALPRIADSIAPYPAHTDVDLNALSSRDSSVWLLLALVVVLIALSAVVVVVTL